MPPDIKEAVKADSESSTYKQKNLKPTSKFSKSDNIPKKPFDKGDPKTGRLGTVNKVGRSGICINSPLCDSSKSYMFTGDVSGPNNVKVIRPYVNKSVAYYYDDTLDDPFTFDLSNDSYVIGPPLDIPTGSFIQCLEEDKYYVYQGNNNIRQAYYSYLEMSANALLDKVRDCSKFTNVTTQSGGILDLSKNSFIKCGTAPINGLPGPLDSKGNPNPAEGAIQHNNKYSWKNAIYQYMGRTGDKPLIQWIPTSDIGASLTYDALTNTYGRAYNDKPYVIDCEKNKFYRDSEPSKNGGNFAVPKDVKLNYKTGTLVSCKSSPYKDKGETGDLSGIYDINTNVYLFKSGATSYRDSTKIKDYEKTNIPGTLQWIPNIKYYQMFFTNPGKNQDWDNPIVINCNENKIPRDINDYEPDKTILYKDKDNNIYRYVGFNGKTNKIQMELVNTTNAWIINSQYFDTNSSKKFVVFSVDANTEIVDSTDIVKEKYGWRDLYNNTNLNSSDIKYFFFGEDKTYYYVYYGFNKIANKNYIFRTDTYQKMDNYISSFNKQGTTPKMTKFNTIPDLGGWIIRNGRYEMYQCVPESGSKIYSDFLLITYDIECYNSQGNYISLDTTKVNFTITQSTSTKTKFEFIPFNNSKIVLENLDYVKNSSGVHITLGVVDIPVIIWACDGNGWLTNTLNLDTHAQGNTNQWILTKYPYGGYFSIKNVNKGKYLGKNGNNLTLIAQNGSTLPDSCMWKLDANFTTIYIVSC